jgi:branched-chain amino acid transport system ATP-binding protein
LTELCCQSIGVRFGGLRALHDVTLSVPMGQVTALIGPNGAGKTTLFNVITGICPPQSGTVSIGDRDVTKLRPARRARLGLARTFQRLELFGSLTTRENIRMAAETQRRRLPAGVTPISQTDQLLDTVGLGAVADEPTDSLPTGLARLVEVARALATEPSILLLDEPSSGLDYEETSALGRLLTELADAGMGVLLVEHDMKLVMGISDLVTVLNYGEVIACGSPEVVSANPDVRTAYLGTEEASHDPIQEPRGSTSPSHRLDSPIVIDEHMNGPETLQKPNAVAMNPPQAVVEAPPSDPMIDLRDVRASYGRIEVIHGVTLSVQRGSVTALLGPNGAGKSTLLKVASGLLAPSSGSVSIDGTSILGVPAERLARQRVCSVPEGRAVFPNLTVYENLRMFTYRSRDSNRSTFVEQTFVRFPALAERGNQLAGQLSGGEQQMLAISRALCTSPKVLLLDELSMGLAPLIVSDLYAAVGQLVADEQLTVLLAEQFATLALEISDHACIMIMGEIVDHGDPDLIGSNLSNAYLAVSE